MTVDSDLDPTEVTYIDCGLTDILALHLAHGLTVVNLHYNRITQIQGLDHLDALKHLDLSANQITRIGGLERLNNLRTLNLASNRIKKVEGLAKLRNLVKINLSYNEINDVSGFMQLVNQPGSSAKLTSIDLHGNQIRLVSHLVKSLSGLPSLRHLTLINQTQKNPVCDIKDYKSLVLRGLPQLSVLDGHDRHGTPVQISVLADIPGLDDFLEYLSSSYSECGDQPVLPTPKIDAARKAFQHRPMANKSRVERQADAEPEKKDDYQIRVGILEAQLTELMRSKNQAERDNDQTVPSKESDSTINKDDSTQPQEITTTSDSDHRARSHHQQQPASSSSNQEAGRDIVKTPRSAGRQEPGSTKTSRIRQQRTSSTPASVPKQEGSQPKQEGSQATFGEILRELDSERERRWKAEEACRRLMDHVKQIQEKTDQDSHVQDAALTATSKLREAFATERELRLKTDAQLEQAQAKVEHLMGKVKDQDKTIDKLTDTLKKMESNSVRVHAEKSKEVTMCSQRVQEAQLSASAANRELELVQGQVTSLQGQIQQLQALMATRERDYQGELSRRYTLDSKELQDIIERNVSQTSHQYQQKIASLEERISEWKAKYKGLEDEFRMALRIEADRFQEIQSVYERTLQDCKITKHSNAEMIKKEDDTKQMLAELTALVKEQKTKITEITRSRQEMAREYKERVGTLEAHVEEARSRMLEMEMTKQENKKLVGRIEAQESVIEGLRSERKLWSEELAQQGASLAQDRGRLESKLETRDSEVETLKKHLEREADTVKIKAKLIEDQTETIRKLKETISERDKEIQRGHESSHKTLNETEALLREERQIVKELQDKIGKLNQRKEELKDEVMELHEKFENEQKSHDSLARKWREKSESISRLESQVMEMKKIWEEKEEALCAERDSSLERERSLQDQLRRLDQGFRDQLSSAEAGKDAAVAAARSAADRELREARTRIIQVEEEMREVLAESDRLRRTTEAKISRLTSALKDLTSDA